MDYIEAAELHSSLEEGREVRLVMALGRGRYEQAHIPGSAPFEEVADANERREPVAAVVVYCTGGLCAATLHAYRVLLDRGHHRVRILRGGLEAWADAGLPIQGSAYELVEVAA